MGDYILLTEVLLVDNLLKQNGGVNYRVKK